jgi:prepilin-type N-terminal cleavage/methylation domain-containing protein
MSMSNSLNRNSPRLSKGMSLIEMMIALVAGLVVIGAVLTFTVATVRAYNENIRSTRLTQDLRTGMNLAVREIRRSGYDAASVNRIFSATSPSSFTALSAVQASTGCVIYRYDRGVGAIGDAPAATELRGIRLNSTTGTLQMDATSSSIDCSGTGSSWVDLTDPNVVNVTRFEPTVRDLPFCVPIDHRVVAGVDQYDFATGTTRNLLLNLTGSLRADSTLSRSIVDSVRVRAENVVFTTNSLTPCS